MSIELKMHERLGKALSKGADGTEKMIDPATISLLVNTIFTLIGQCQQRTAKAGELETPQEQVVRMRNMTDGQRRRILKARQIQEDFDGKARNWRRNGGPDMLDAAMREFDAASNGELVQLVEAARWEKSIIDG